MSGHTNVYCNTISAILEIQWVPPGDIADAASYRAALLVCYNIPAPVMLIVLGAERGRASVAPAPHVQETKQHSSKSIFYY